jgi:hypothetical protein
MAKISANGATEKARIKTKSPGGYEYLWVMTSDGRVLRRVIGEVSTGYTVFRRNWRGDRTQAVLSVMAAGLGHTIIS